MAHADERQVTDVLPVDKDGPAVEVVEAGEHPGDRRLARPGATDDGHPLARLDRERAAVENRCPGLAVTKGDVTELDPSLWCPQVRGAGRVDDLRFLVEQLVDPLRRSAGPLRLDE